MMRLLAGVVQVVMIWPVFQCQSWGAACNIVVVSLPEWLPGIPRANDPSIHDSSAHGINNRGQVAGGGPLAQGGPGGPTFAGFLRSGGKYTNIAVPGARDSSPWGINSQGDIVGFLYSDFTFALAFNTVGATDHGFLFSAGQFKMIDYPGISAGTRVYGINDNGDMVGAFRESPSSIHAFKLSHGSFNRLFPNEASTSSFALGINNSGQIVGFLDSGHGFLVDASGTLKTIDFPGAKYTYTLGINDSGDIVGAYYFASGVPHGFLLSNGVFTSFDGPLASPMWGGTLAYGINSGGQIVGDGGGNAFAAVCGPVSPTAMAVSGGDAQSALVGSTLPQPLMVDVTTAGGYGALGVNVQFAITSGNGSLGALTATSEVDGTASTTLTLGNSPGTTQVTASVPGLAPATFRETAMPAPPLPITASPPSVTLNYAVGSPKPAPVMLGVLAGSAVSFSVTTPPGAIWLSVKPTGGQTPATLAVTIDPSGLPVGSYRASVTITPTTAGFSPLTVPVTVMVLPSADGLQFSQAVTKSVSPSVPVALALSIPDLYLLTNNIEIYQNNPTVQASVNLTAQPMVVLPSGSAPTALLALDLNGDQLADLIVLDQAAAAVTTFLAGATGYSVASTFPANTNPSAIAMLNLTGNANSGLVVIGDDGVALFTANGDGTFTPATTFDVMGRQGKLLAVATGSFTGSGLDDIVLSDAGGNIWLLPSDGAGGFGNPTLAHAGANPSALAVGDFNGDGNLDLAVANSGSSSVSLLLGDGAGNLGPAATFNIFAPVGPVTLAAADFNSDGNLDLAVALAGNNTVCLLKGDGAGGFGTPLQYLVGITPIALAIGDIDGDGKPDIAVGNRQSRDLSILLNQN